MTDLSKLNDEIIVGTRVIVEWENLVPLIGTILYVPCDTGDSWRIKGDDGKLLYVNTFCLMTRIP